jgi:hypothetical protein
MAKAENLTLGIFSSMLSRLLNLYDGVLNPLEYVCNSGTFRSLFLAKSTFFLSLLNFLGELIPFLRLIFSSSERIYYLLPVIIE